MLSRWRLSSWKATENCPEIKFCSLGTKPAVLERDGEASRHFPLPASVVPGEAETPEAPEPGQLQQRQTGN